jgi:c-di-GMP-binding flagellar brake protein YcgR
MNDHIGKPIYIDDMMEKLRAYLGVRTLTLTGVERREHPRVPMDTTALLKRIGEEAAADARIINFSVGGILIATEEKLKTEETITLVFSLGNDEKVDGVVLRVNDANNGEREAAVKFENVSIEQRKRFYRFTEKSQQAVAAR